MKGTSPDFLYGNLIKFAYNENSNMKGRSQMNKNSIDRHILDATLRSSSGNASAVDRERAVINEILEGKSNCTSSTTQNDTSANCTDCSGEHGGDVYSLSVAGTARKNRSFRESVWTGDHLQLTVMSIDRGNDIGVEVHNDTDQYIRVEQGCAVALVGASADNLSEKYRLFSGDAIFIPACTWHNIVNSGRGALKLSSIYAPPHHPRCTVQRNK